MQLVDVDPHEHTFRIAFERCTDKLRNNKQEAEPVLSMFPEPRPADRAAKGQVEALDSRFLLDFATHAGDYIFIRLEFSSQAIVLAKVMILVAQAPMDHEDPLAVWRKHVTEGCEYWRVRHEGAFTRDPGNAL